MPEMTEKDDRKEPVEQDASNSASVDNESLRAMIDAIRQNQESIKEIHSSLIESAKPIPGEDESADINEDFEEDIRRILYGEKKTARTSPHVAEDELLSLDSEGAGAIRSQIEDLRERTFKSQQELIRRLESAKEGIKNEILSSVQAQMMFNEIQREIPWIKTDAGRALMNSVFEKEARIAVASGLSPEAFKEHLVKKVTDLLDSVYAAREAAKSKAGAVRLGYSGVMQETEELSAEEEWERIKQKAIDDEYERKLSLGQVAPD